MSSAFAIKTIAGTTLFEVDDSGNVTAAGTISTTGTDDFGTNGIKADVVAESTAATGVTVDGLRIMDATIKPAAGGSAFIDLSGVATGEADVIVKDNLADALTFREGANAYLTFVTTDASESVTIAKSLKVTSGTVDLMSGATDIKLVDNNATALRVREGTNSRDYIIIDTGDGSESIQFGDAAVNPVYSFAGTGATTFGGKLLTDDLVKATITVPDTAGGATAALATVALKRADNSTAIASAKQVLVTAAGVQYLPFTDAAAVGSVTFSLATTGSIIATGAGWALIETDATGAAAFTISNTDDETTYFSVQTAASVSDLAKSCVVLASNSDAATWSA